MALPIAFSSTLSPILSIPFNLTTHYRSEVEALKTAEQDCNGEPLIHYLIANEPEENSLGLIYSIENKKLDLLAIKNDQGETCLHVAIRFKRHSIVCVLIERFHPIERRHIIAMTDQAGNSALHLTCLNDDLEACTFLLSQLDAEAKASLCTIENREGLSPLSYGLTHSPFLSAMALGPNPIGSYLDRTTLQAVAGVFFANQEINELILFYSFLSRDAQKIVREGFPEVNAILFEQLVNIMEQRENIPDILSSPILLNSLTAHKDAYGYDLIARAITNNQPVFFLQLIATLSKSQLQERLPLYLELTLGHPNPAFFSGLLELLKKHQFSFHKREIPLERGLLFPVEGQYSHLILYLSFLFATNTVQFEEEFQRCLTLVNNQENPDIQLYQTLFYFGSQTLGKKILEGIQINPDLYHPAFLEAFFTSPLMQSGLALFNSTDLFNLCVAMQQTSAIESFFAALSPHVLINIMLKSEIGHALFCTYYIFPKLREKIPEIIDCLEEAILREAFLRLFFPDLLLSLNPAMTERLITDFADEEVSYRLLTTQNRRQESFFELVYPDVDAGYFQQRFALYTQHLYPEDRKLYLNSERAKVSFFVEGLIAQNSLNAAKILTSLIQAGYDLTPNQIEQIKENSSDFIAAMRTCYQEKGDLALFDAAIGLSRGYIEEARTALDFGLRKTSFAKRLSYSPTIQETFLFEEYGDNLRAFVASQQFDVGNASLYLPFLSPAKIQTLNKSAIIAGKKQLWYEGEKISLRTAISEIKKTITREQAQELLSQLTHKDLGALAQNYPRRILHLVPSMSWRQLRVILPSLKTKAHFKLAAERVTITQGQFFSSLTSQGKLIYLQGCVESPPQFKNQEARQKHLNEIQAAISRALKGEEGNMKSAIRAELTKYIRKLSDKENVQNGGIG